MVTRKVYVQNSEIFFVKKSRGKLEYMENLMSLLEAYQRYIEGVISENFVTTQVQILSQTIVMHFYTLTEHARFSSVSQRTFQSWQFAEISRNNEFQDRMMIQTKERRNVCVSVPSALLRGQALDAC